MTKIHSCVVILALVFVTGISSCVDGDATENVLSCDYGDRSMWGMCMIYGDPHIVTTDNMAYRFKGRCEYILAQYCEPEDGDMRITAGFRERQVNRDQTTAISVTVRINGHTIKIEKPGVVTVNGDVVSLPHHQDLGDGFEIWIFKVGNEYMIRIKENGEDRLRISYTPKFHRILIHFIRYEYLENVCGMCGNFDDKDKNDHKSKSNKRKSLKGSGAGTGTGTGRSGRTGRSRRRRSDSGTDSFSKKFQDFGSYWKLDPDCDDV